MKKPKVIQRKPTELIIADRLALFGKAMRFFFGEVIRFIVFGVLWPVLRTVELLARFAFKYGRWVLVAALCVSAVPFAALAAVCVVCVLVLAVPVFLIVK